MTGIAQKIISNPEAYSIDMLTAGVQNGTVPAYIGIPLIQQKTQELNKSKALMGGMQQQPPIAQQVLDQAQQATGLTALPTNLPAQGYAPGGIIAFAEGGEADDEEDEFDMSKDEQQLFDMLRRRLASNSEYEEMAGLGALPVDVSKIISAKHEVSSKVGDQPKKTRSEGITQLTKEGTPEDLIAKIMQKESGGRRFDKQGNLLTSPKGAQGEMQVMPATSRDPGFGIRPAREGDADDLARVGREYFGKMLNKYGDPKLAAIAYNWGPGNTDKWLMAGADPSKLPRETQKYSADMAGGGAVHFDGGGIADIFNMSKEEVAEYMRRKLRMEQARDAFSKAPAATESKAARLGPTATQNKPSASMMSRLSSLFGNPYTAVGAGGAGITALTGNYLDRLSDEELEALQNSGGGDDTALAAAIMRQGREKPSETSSAKKQPPAPAAPSNKPFVQPSVSEAQATALAGPQAAVPPKQPEVPEAAPAAPEAAAPTDAMGNYLGEYAAYLKDRREQMAADKEQNKYLALLQAGLGMMGGTSPYAGANIGQGASQGVAAYLAGQKQASADDRALQQGMLGLTRAELYEKMHAADLAQKKEQKAESLKVSSARQQASEREGMEKLAAGIEAQIGKSIDASGKLAALEAIGKSASEIAAERQKLINQTLMGNTTQARRYQALMKKLGYDVEESKGASSGVLNYDPTTRSLR
jgi:hypothetical protein